MGKIVLITGTSSGFGQMAIPLYLERGWTVMATLRDAATRGPKIFAKELNSSDANRLHIVELDVQKSTDWDNAARYIDEKFNGQLDVLVNNAGYGLLGTLEDQTMEQIRQQFEVNFFGLAGLTRRLLPYLRRSRGRILNISSIGGLITVPMCGTYNATKFAVEGLTEGLYYELRPLGVQVGLIEPGGYRTEFTGRSMNLAANANNPQSPYAALNQLMIKILARNGGGDPIVVARKIVRLSESSRVPLRTLSGPDAHMLAFLRRILPHSLRVGIIGLLLSLGLKQTPANKQLSGTN
jgi:NAD(P)-dependent dehydrogenase (short-subunit alcohol dehydrogenase family)